MFWAVMPYCKVEEGEKGENGIERRGPFAR